MFPALPDCLLFRVVGESQAETIVRYASRGLDMFGREVVDARPPAAPLPKEKAAVPMGGDRVSASRRYSDMVRWATGSYDF